MTNLIVGFSTHRKFNLFSKLIQWVDGTSFSHVYIRWHSDFIDRDVVYQASGLAVNFQEGHNFDAVSKTIYQFNIQMSDETKKKVIQFAMDQSGKAYSIKQVLGIAWVRFNGLFGKKITNPWKNGRTSYVCCELVAQILEDNFGYKISEDLDDMSPGDLFKIMNEKLS